MEESGDNIDDPLCEGLYKEDYNYIVPWSGTYPYAKINCFAQSKQDNDWIVPADHYNKEFNKWRGPIHNGQFRSQTLQEKIQIEETCTKYAVSTKFNGIPREEKTEIPIKSYKDKWHEPMIRDRMWDALYLPYPRYKQKKWGLLLHQSRFPLDYVKLHVQSLQKGSEAYHYMVQKFSWSRVYLRSNLSNTLLLKVLTLVPLAATVPELLP